MLPLRKLYELIHEYPRYSESFKKEARAKTAEKIDPLTIPLTQQNKLLAKSLRHGHLRTIQPLIGAGGMDSLA